MILFKGGGTYPLYPPGSYTYGYVYTFTKETVATYYSAKQECVSILIKFNTAGYTAMSCPMPYCAAALRHTTGEMARTMCDEKVGLEDVPPCESNVELKKLAICLNRK